MATNNITRKTLIDSVMKETPRETVYFGQVTSVDVWPCRLAKGSPRVRLDPDEDDLTGSLNVVTLVFQSLREDFSPTQRDMVSDLDRGWRTITRPSLKKLGADLELLQDRYAQIKMVPTGEEFTNREGVIVKKTAIQFTCFFPDRETAEEVAETYFHPKGAAVSASAASYNVPRALLDEELPF